MGNAGDSSGYAPFLHAKRTVDERARNERIWRLAVGVLEEAPADRPLRVLELGAGVGGMVERLLGTTTTRSVHYTLVDNEPTHMDALGRELLEVAERQGLYFERADEHRFVMTHGLRRVDVILDQADVYAFLDGASRGSFDLLIAQAFLDLFDIEPLLTRLIEVVAPGGGMYFPIMFDGVTSWLPVIDATFDARVEHLYHRSMDVRGAAAERAPRSHTGRHVAYELACRPEIAAVEVGGSDWVVGAPMGSDLPEMEACFLHELLDGYARELTGHPELDADRWQTWLTLRRRSVQTGSVMFFAHHLDLFARRQFSDISRSRFPS